MRKHAVQTLGVIGLALATPAQADVSVTFQEPSTIDDGVTTLADAGVQLAGTRLLILASDGTSVTSVEVPASSPTGGQTLTTVIAGACELGNEVRAVALAEPPALNSAASNALPCPAPKVAPPTITNVIIVKSDGSIEITTPDQ